MYVITLQTRCERVYWSHCGLANGFSANNVTSWPYYNHLCFAIETKPVDSLTPAKSSYELISQLCVLKLCVRVVAGMWSLTFWGCDHSHSVTKFLLLMFEYFYVIAWTQMLSLQWLITHLPHTLRQAQIRHNSLNWLPIFHTHCGKLGTQFHVLITKLPHTLRGAQIRHNSLYW